VTRAVAVVLKSPVPEGRGFLLDTASPGDEPYMEGVVFVVLLKGTGDLRLILG
jgi:hypothetical protein